MVAAPEQRHNLDSADPFAVLGLDPFSQPIDKKVIKLAYKRLARQYHPDVATNKDSSDYERKWASEQFSKINMAYETLCRNLEKELASRPHMWNPAKRRPPKRDSYGVRPNPGQHQSRWNAAQPQDSSPYGNNGYYASNGYYVGVNDFDMPKYDSVNSNRKSNNHGGVEATREYWNSPKVQGPEAQYGSVSGEAFGGGHWVGADFHTKPNRDENGDVGETFGEETIFADFFTGNFEEFFTGATGVDYSTAKKPPKQQKQPYNETKEEAETIFNDFAAKVGSVDLKPRHHSTTEQQVSTEVSEGTETVFNDFYSGEQAATENISPKQNFDATTGGQTSGAETVFTDFANGKASTSATGSNFANGAEKSASDAAKGAAVSDPYGMYFGTMNTVDNGENKNADTANGASSETGASNGVSAEWEEYYAKANAKCGNGEQTYGATNNMSSGDAADNIGDNAFHASDSAASESEANNNNGGGTVSWSMGGTSGSPSNASPDAANGIHQESTINGIPQGSSGTRDDLNEAAFAANNVNYGSDSEATYASNNGVGYDYSSGGSNGSNGASTDSTYGAPSHSVGIDYGYASGDSTDSYNNGASNGASHGSNEATYDFSQTGASKDYSSNGVRFNFANGGSSNGMSSGTATATAGKPSVTASVAASGPGTSYHSVNIASDVFSGPETIVNDFVNGVTGAVKSSGGGVFQDIVDVLKRNVEGNVGGSGYILGGDDPELNKLLHAGTVEEIGTEMVDTEMVVQHLTSKSEDLDSEITRIQAELAANKKLANKIALQQMEAECRARKVVVEEFLPRALERMRSLQGRYKDLIGELGPGFGTSTQQRPDVRTQGSSWRSNWPPSGRSKSSSRGSSSLYSTNENEGPQMSAEAAAKAKEKRAKLLEVDDRFDRMIKDFEASRRGWFNT